MSGARPNSETAKRMGMVPYNGDANGSNSNRNMSGAASYPTVNDSVKKTGNPAQENVNRGVNNQLWSNGSGTQNQGSAPTWPTNDQGVPISPNNGWQSKQAGAPGAVGGGYIQGPQPGNGSGAPYQQQQQQHNWQANNGQQQQQPNWQANNGQQQQQPNWQVNNGPQQQQPNWQANNVQQGIPVSSPSGGYVQGPQPVNNNATQQQQQPNWEGPKGGYISQPGPQKPMPKGDYVYYDGNGNQIQPGVLAQGPNGSLNGTGSGSERHFHHHYHHNHVSQPEPQPIGYPYDKNMEQKKKRRPGAAALAALLVTCWACTCCCHAPCGC